MAKKPIVKVEGATDGSVVVKRPHRYRPGTVALREIRKFQKRTGNLIQRAPVERLIRELAQKTLGEGHDGVRFGKEAIAALQEAAEQYVVEKHRMAQVFAIHAGRQTITSVDLKLSAALKPVDGAALSQ